MATDSVSLDCKSCEDSGGGSVGNTASAKDVSVATGLDGCVITSCCIVVVDSLVNGKAVIVSPIISGCWLAASNCMGVSTNSNNVDRTFTDGVAVRLRHLRNV